MNENARTKAANLKFWSSPVEPEPLGGGITNTNFIVSDRDERFVVRIGGDIIVGIDGQSVKGMDDLITYLETRQVGQQVVLTIVRGGNERQVEVTLEERPAR